MANTFFKFKKFTIHQDRSAMKVTTDASLFGAWVAGEVESLPAGRQVQSGKILDIGTGTGLLSLMIAQKNSWPIDAVEIDPGAAGQARENIAASPWQEQITVHEADIRNQERHHQYNVIVSNPPFYENELMSPDQKVNLARHGNELSLADLLPILRQLLAPGGRFFLLLPYKRMEEIKNLVTKNQLMISAAILVRQSVHHEPFRVMIAGSLAAEYHIATTISEISVWDGKREYTPEFVALLKEYYLAL